MAFIGILLQCCKFLIPKTVDLVLISTDTIKTSDSSLYMHVCLQNFPFRSTYFQQNIISFKESYVNIFVKQHFSMPDSKGCINFNGIW